MKTPLNIISRLDEFGFAVAPKERPSIVLSEPELRSACLAQLVDTEPEDGPRVAGKYLNIVPSRETIARIAGNFPVEVGALFAPPTLDTVMRERGTVSISDLTHGDVYHLGSDDRRIVACSLLSVLHIVNIELAAEKKARWFAERNYAQAQMRDAERELEAAQKRNRGET